jgi:hypothetical protein
MTEFSLLYNVVMSSPEPEAQLNISVRKVSSVRLSIRPSFSASLPTSHAAVLDKKSKMFRSISGHGSHFGFQMALKDTTLLKDSLHLN